MRSGLVYRDSAGNFIRQGRMRDRFGPVDWCPGRMQFAAERVVIAVFAMVRFGMCVRGSAHLLEIRFGQWRLVWRKRVLPTGAAAAEENNGDECRENG